MSPAVSSPADPGASSRSGDAERILASARRHFFAHGFRRVTVDDLAAELRMSKKTFYTHYPSKTALVEAVIRDKLSRADADLRAVMGEPEMDFSVRLQSLLACLHNHTDEIQAVFVRDIRSEAPELFALVQEGRGQAIQRYFGQVLEEGRQAGMIRQDIPLEFLIEILVRAVDAIANPKRLGELELTPKTALTRIVSVFLEGVIVRKGGVAQ